MKRKNITLTIETKTYKRFTKYCKDKGINRSYMIEGIIKTIMKTHKEIEIMVMEEIAKETYPTATQQPIKKIKKGWKLTGKETKLKKQ